VEGERHLGDQTDRVDRVGREQRAVATQGLVGQRALHHRLAVVERTIDGERHHAGTGAGDLRFLHAADADARIKDDRADAGNAGAGFGDGGAGITGSRGEDRQLRELVAEDTRGDAHERTDGEILERRGRPLEELEDGDAFGRRALELFRAHEGHRKIEGFLAKFAEDRRPEDLGEIRGDDGLGEVGIGGVAMALHEIGRDLRDMRGHPEAALGRHGRKQHVAQGTATGGVGGGDEFQLRTRRGHGHPWD
jgi:hypothetical protein